MNRVSEMDQYRPLRPFLALFFIICISLMFCPAATRATKLDIDLSLSIPYFLRMSYSNGSLGETITTQDQIIDRLIPLEYTARQDAQYESVIDFEIRSNADWQLTIIPVNIDTASYWIIHEDANLPNQPVNVDRPLCELGQVLQGTPQSPVGWHLHVLSPRPSSENAKPSIRVCVEQQRH